VNPLRFFTYIYSVVKKAKRVSGYLVSSQFLTALGIFRQCIANKLFPVFDKHVIGALKIPGTFYADIFSLQIHKAKETYDRHQKKLPFFFINYIFHTLFYDKTNYHIL